MGPKGLFSRVLTTKSTWPVHRRSTINTSLTAPWNGPAVPVQPSCQRPASSGRSATFAGLERTRDGASQAVRSAAQRGPVVRSLDGPWLLPQRARRARALHHRHSPAQRDRRAAHGAHAEQHHPGRAGAARPHAGEERLLGAGRRSCIHRHRGQGGEEAPRRGTDQAAARPREVPGACLGLEGAVRRRDPGAAQEARGQLRLGTHALHHGALAERGGHRCLHRPAQERARVPWPTHGELGSPGAHRRQRRGGDPQGGELPPVPRPLQDRRHGRRVDHHRHHASGDHPGRHRGVRSPGRPALRAPEGEAVHHPDGGAFRAGDLRRLHRHGVRHGLPEGDARARHQRLGDRPAPWAGGHRHAEPRWHHERGRRLLCGRGPLRGAQEDRQGPGGQRPPGEGGGHREQGGIQRAHRRGDRTPPEPAVVREDGPAGQARAGRRDRRPREAAPRQVREHLPPLDGERPRLVHQPPALVGAAHSGLVQHGR